MFFSIIVTSYNQREFIRDAVDSALAARNAGAEIVVVDDASTDGSRELLSSYGGAIRLAALTENRGAAAARNHGAGMASGDYLVFLDGDDALQPWALQVYERIVRARMPKLLLASRLWFQGALPALGAGDRPQAIHFATYEDYMSKDRTFGPSASAMVIARDALRTVGGWSDYFTGMEDLDLLIRLGDAGRTVQILSPTTCSYRVHCGNISKQVPRYINEMHKMLNLESTGAYPGGDPRRFERHAALGGHVLSWTRRGFQAGLYRDALRLAVVGWPMLFAAAARHVQLIQTGRRVAETITA